MRRAYLLMSALVALALWTVTAHAQGARNATWFKAYDVTATSYTYPLLTGPDGSPFVGTNPGNAAVSTTGSSTTVAATTASTAPFLNVGVGDQLFFMTAPGTAVSTRYVTAVASTDSITVDTAITLTARPFTYKHFATGTGATSGWIDASSVGKTVQLCVTTLNATSISFSIEGKLVDAPSSATLIAPTYTATGCDLYVVPESMDQLRVGVKVNTDTGVQSVSAVFQSQVNR